MEYQNLHELIKIVKQLRHPKDGCPWDLEQTHKSLTKYLIEESYEFIHAVENDDYNAMNEELGDVLLQILLHATIAEEQKNFDLESVAKTLGEKLVRRHPHVFGDLSNNIDADQVHKNWDKIKEQEKAGQRKSLLKDGLLMNPALIAADNIGKKTEKIGFDWDSYHQVLYKVEEEWQEIKEELSPRDEFNAARVEEELGDFLFSTAQLCRHLKMNPEKVLAKANRKFLMRFREMEGHIQEAGKKLEELDKNELEEYWNYTKKVEKNGSKA